MIIGLIIFGLLQIVMWVLIARMIISWVVVLAPGWRPPKLLAAIFEIIYLITDPPINAINKVIPPLRLGDLSLDLGFMVLFLIVVILQRLTLVFLF